MSEREALEDVIATALTNIEIVCPTETRPDGRIGVALDAVAIAGVVATALLAPDARSVIHAAFFEGSTDQ